MNWTKLNFGRHAGKTLPFVLLTDPDWFFWATSKAAFPYRSAIALEASTLFYKATHIQIPDVGGVRQEVEHYIHLPTKKYSHFVLVPASKEKHGGASPTIRSSVLDMTVPRTYAPFDKLGYKNFVNSLRGYYFGGTDSRLSSRRAETFFDKDENFIDAGGSPARKVAVSGPRPHQMHSVC